MTTVTVSTSALRTVLDAFKDDEGLTALRAATKQPNTLSPLEVLAFQLERTYPQTPEMIHRTRDQLPLGPTRDHLLSEAATRADYYFRQTDGSYEYPSQGGQVSQLIGMLLAAANTPESDLTNESTATKGQRVCKVDSQSEDLEGLISQIEAQIFALSSATATLIETLETAERSLVREGHQESTAFLVIKSALIAHELKAVAS